LFARYSPSVVQVVCRDARGDTTITGSGFILGMLDRGLEGLPWGLIATNYHVIEHAHAALVVCSDGISVPVLGVAAVDEVSDLAILTAAVALDRRPLDLAADEPPVGARVYAIGNPLGLANTLSDGLVSGYREMDQGRVIQTTAPISPGSSGGPLVAEDGRVVGVTTFLLRGGQNLNFAVPAAQAGRLLRSCKPGGKLTTLPLVRPPDAAEYTARGKALNKKGEYDRAITEFDRAIRLDSEFWLALFDRGNAWFAKEEFEKAIADYSAVIRLGPPGSDALAKAYYNRANAWGKLLNFKRAVADYDMALRHDPTMAVAYCNRGRACAQRKEYNAAIRDFNEAIRLQPANAQFYFYRGSTWFEMKQYEAARKDLDEAGRLDPELFGTK
jgi:Flp pilus assembly protein TadD